MHEQENTPENGSVESVDFYDSTYGRFGEALYQDIRAETWGEDIGQNSWITAVEQDRFIDWLALGPQQNLLDIACGSGGPTLRLAARSGATVVGVDVHSDGIKAAKSRANEVGLSRVATFEVVNAQGPLPFADASFDAVLCIDAINHLADRPRVLAEWTRVLKPGGKVLFTDPIVVTGAITSEEIAVRSAIGYFVFVAPDTNDSMLADAGLRCIERHDLTEALATTAFSWRAARQKRSAQLRRVEGDKTFEGQQRFLDVAARLARERRLSRWAYFAVKPLGK